VNGMDYPKLSAFHLSRIKADFDRTNNGVPAQQCNWYIGTAKLAPEVSDSLRRDKYKLYQTPVTLIPGAVGAILIPPTMPSNV
jgi:hypothetical protein